LDKKELTKYELDVANSIITHDMFPVLDSYKTEVNKYFNASVYSTDFSTHGREAMQMINDWVKQQTHGKIDKLLTQPLDPSVVMVLLNAIYFKGVWKIQFNESMTKEESFFGYGNNQFKVPLMRVLDKFNHTNVNEVDSQLIELPYAGNHISMYILLPNQKDGLKQVKKSIDSNFLDKAIGQMKEMKVEVAVPKFQFSTKYALVPYLKTLGIQNVFNSNSDLSGIDGRKDLYVSDVIHKAVIEVNEKGSEAAAVTEVIISRSLPHPSPIILSFRADHPFAFFLKDNRNGMILFEGHVNKF